MRGLLVGSAVIVAGIGSPFLVEWAASTVTGFLVFATAVGVSLSLLLRGSS